MLSWCSSASAWTICLSLASQLRVGVAFDQPRDLHGERRAARDDVAAGEHELARGAQHALPVDAGMGLEMLVLVGDQHLEEMADRPGRCVTGSRQMPSAVVKGRSSAPLRSTTASDTGMVAASGVGGSVRATSAMARPSGRDVECRQHQAEPRREERRGRSPDRRDGAARTAIRARMTVARSACRALALTARRAATSTVPRRYWRGGPDDTCPRPWRPAARTCRARRRGPCRRSRCPPELSASEA